MREYHAILIQYSNSEKKKEKEHAWFLLLKFTYCHIVAHMLALVVLYYANQSSQDDSKHHGMGFVITI